MHRSKLSTLAIALVAAIATTPLQPARALSLPGISRPTLPSPHSVPQSLSLDSRPLAQEPFLVSIAQVQAAEPSSLTAVAEVVATTPPWMWILFSAVLLGPLGAVVLRRSRTQQSEATSETPSVTARTESAIATDRQEAARLESPVAIQEAPTLAATMPAPAPVAVSAPAPVAQSVSEPAPSAPEALASETQAPEALAPETLVPEALAPETQAPETQAPETLAPETQAPETLAPETQAPETQAPETQAPEALAPEAPSVSSSTPPLRGTDITPAATVGAAAMTSAAMLGDRGPTQVEAAKYDVGGAPAAADISVPETLAGVDDGLAELPEGYGESSITLLPRDPQWAYAYWDVPNDQKQALRQQGGVRLALRLYDVTDLDFSRQAAHKLQQYDCDEMAREWYLPIPMSDRDYALEIGYLTADDRWLTLARSATVRVPPVYPSNWFDEHFETVNWEDDLRGATIATLVPPGAQPGQITSLHEQMYSLSQDADAQRVAGSIFGSMQHVPGSMQHVPGSVYGSIQHLESISSHEWASGQGIAAGVPTVSGLSSWAIAGEKTLSGAALYTQSGAGLMGRTASGIGMSSWTFAGLPGGMSGAGLMGMTASGVGMSSWMLSGAGVPASMPPIRPRQFWLVADAELIVHGATEPDATVTIGGVPIQLEPDGTFRFHMAFPDGDIDYPIMAVAADGEQSRAIHMEFDRETPERNTNTKEEATPEWFN